MDVADVERPSVTDSSKEAGLPRHKVHCPNCDQTRICQQLVDDPDEDHPNPTTPYGCTVCGHEFSI